MSNILWELKRLLQITPTQQIFKDIEKKGVVLKGMKALEVFGGTGEVHTRDYASKVGSLEVWEIDLERENLLRKNLPQAKIKITDSFEEIKRTPNKYDIVVIDNYASFCGNYCEHFDLFPAVFRILEDSAIIILNVTPNVYESAKERYQDHLKRRKSFYKTERPENISFDEMIQIYDRLIQENGYHLRWNLFKRIHLFLYQMVLCISKDQTSIRPKSD